MAYAVVIPARVHTEHRDLAFWMNRTLEELAELRANPSADAVHDLRVALRRCRSLAYAVQEIDTHPDWQELRGGPRKMFRVMGELRDAQIMEGLIHELQPGEDRVKAELLDSLTEVQQRAQDKALRLAAKFDEARWSELARTLRIRLRNIPADGEAARCLALERLEEAKELHRLALRTELPEPWHTLRIGIKRFRYTLELLVPSLHSKWIAALKRVQDLLGDVHDLDTLSDLIAERETKDLLAVGAWQARIESLRLEKLQTYRQLALGEAGLWQNWLSGFPRQEWLALASARIAATRKAMDPKPGRSLAIARIARKLWSQLRNQGVSPFFAGQAERRVLDAAARLSGIRPVRAKKSRVKSARAFLLKLPVPPNWTFAEWQRVAWAVRFQRGAEPSGHKKLSKLAREQQLEIGMLAGILRLAVAAQRSGVRSGAALQVESLPSGLLLQVEGVEETPAIAARFAEGKRLLERSLGTTILVRPTGSRDRQDSKPTPAVPNLAVVR